MLKYSWYPYTFHSKSESEREVDARSRQCVSRAYNPCRERYSRQTKYENVVRLEETHFLGFSQCLCLKKPTRVQSPLSSKPLLVPWKILQCFSLLSRRVSQFIFLFLYTSHSRFTASVCGALHKISDGGNPLYTSADSQASFSSYSRTSRLLVCGYLLELISRVPSFSHTHISISRLSFQQQERARSRCV